MHREDLVFTDASKDQQTIRKYNYKKRKEKGNEVEKD
jgi:hypothetical protein